MHGVCSVRVFMVCVVCAYAWCGLSVLMHGVHGAWRVLMHGVHGVCVCMVCAVCA